jgi:hypothetical protein
MCAAIDWFVASVSRDGWRSVVGEDHVAAIPFEELRPELPFERLDLEAEGRLRQPEPAGRRGEAAVQGNAVEPSKLVEIHVDH